MKEYYNQTVTSNIKWKTMDPNSISNKSKEKDSKTLSSSHF